MAYEEFREIFWKAEVEDLTVKFFEQFDKNLELVARQSETQFARVDQSAQASGREIGFVAGVVGGLTAKFVEMGMQAAASLQNFIKQSIQLTARVGSLGVALGVVGRNMGYTDEQLAQFEKDVKSMGITTRAARQSLLQMAQADLDLARAADIARVAQNAAGIAGVNSSEAFNRIVVAVQRLSPIMLRMLGITVNLQEAYKKFAAENNTTTKALSYQQKQQITLNAVMAAGEGIAGTYAAMMGTLGKQITSLPRYIEEVQLALGAAFQPAFSAQIGYMTDKLKELHEWLVENREEIERFAETLGIVVTKLFELLDEVVKFAAKTPSFIEEAGVALAKIVADLMVTMSPEEIESNRSKLGEYFGQAVTLLVTYISTAVKAITEVMGVGIDMIGIFVLYFRNKVDEAEEATEKLYTRIEGLSDTILDFAGDTVQAMGEFMGVLESTEEGLEDVEDAVDGVSDALDDMHNAIVAARGVMGELKEELEMEAAKRAVEEYRKSVEDALRLSHRVEDLERRHLERLQKAYENYVKSRKRALADLAAREEALVKKRIEGEFDAALARTRKLIDIETDFQRTIQDLKSAFDFEASELARRRDAIGLRRLVRQHQRDLAEAKKDKGRQQVDAEKDYTRRLADLTLQIRREQEKLAADRKKRLRDLEESYREQLAKAEDARQRDYTNLERSLARQKEVEDLHRRWKAEDRQKALREELTEMLDHFANVEGMTAATLRILLYKWEEYFGDLEWLVDEYMTRVEQRMSQATFASPGAPYGFGAVPGVLGQAGQVSQLLASPVQARAPLVWNVPAVSAIPAVPAVRGSANRREIHLSGDVSGLDPYMQRVLVAGIMEIERNVG